MAVNQSVCVLDLGSLYCRAICVSLNEEMEPVIHGVAQVPSVGIIKGEIINTEQAAQVIEECLHVLYQKTQINSFELTLLYSGVTIASFNSLGITTIQGYNRNREVSEDDVERALHSAREIRISNDLERLHDIPRLYKVDGQRVRDNIIGNIGVRLEVEVHIITCLQEAIDNLIEAVKRAGYQVLEIVHSTVSASFISLTPEEQERGALIIDIGYGSISYQYYTEGQPLITGSLPIGGFHISSDIAQVFECSLEVAEHLKLQYGICWPALIRDDLPVVIPGTATSLAQQISQSELCEVLYARLEEVFQIIFQRLKDQHIHQQNIQSIVIIGASAMLRGINELAEEVFERPVRIGYPSEMDSLEPDWYSPEYTSLWGLALYSLENINYSNPNYQKKNSIFQQIAAWFRQIFA